MCKPSDAILPYDNGRPPFTRRLPASLIDSTEVKLWSCASAEISTGDIDFIQPYRLPASAERSRNATRPTRPVLNAWPSAAHAARFPISSFFDSRFAAPWSGAPEYTAARPVTAILRAGAI